MTVADLIGVPVEELLVPLASTGAVLALVTGPWLARLRPRRRRRAS